MRARKTAMATAPPTCRKLLNTALIAADDVNHLSILRSPPSRALAGNVSDHTLQVMASAAVVATAAAAINADLMSEDTRSAVCAAASPFTAEIEARLHREDPRKQAPRAG